jgi:PAS domain S-box-containing protein
VHILTSRVRIGLAIIPTLTIFILWTDPWRGLFYNGMRTGDAILNGGIWFWIFIVYTYIILLLASILIFRKTIRDKQIFQVQAGLLLTGMVLPWFGNIISMLGFSPFPGLDMTPFLFTVSGILFMFALFRFGFLDIAPIAHYRLMEGLLDGVIVLDKSNRIVDYNPAAQRILNLSTTVIGQSLHRAGIQNPDLIVLDQNIHTEKSEIQIENYDLRDFEVRTLALLDKNNQPTGKLVTLHDISEYRQAQEQIRRSEEQYRLLFDNAVESILVVQDRKIVFCNPITSELTGYPLEEIINESFVKFIYPEDIPMILENYRKRVEGVNLQGRYQFRLVRKDLSFRWVETSGIRIDWEGELATLHFIMDVTDRKKAEVALEFRSTHDILTGLYNRQYFEQEIDRLQNSRRQPVSILVMDMNGLKEINDTQDTPSETNN